MSRVFTPGIEGRREPAFVVFAVTSARCQRFFRFATFAACLPSAVRVRLGKCAIVRWRFAAAAAFLMFRRAAAR